MLISFWWIVVAFILGGTGGMLALALFSAMPNGDERDNVEFSSVSNTR